jgi:uncharacterized membrane protein YkvA (DUF1232 family)
MFDDPCTWTAVGIALLAFVPACGAALWLLKSPMPKRIAKAVYWAIFDKQQCEVPSHREPEHRADTMQTSVALPTAMTHVPTPSEAPTAPPWWSLKSRPLLVVCLCIIYVISPIDLLPEAFLGPFGLVDDLGALFLAFNAVKKAIQGAESTIPTHTFSK